MLSLVQMAYAEEGLPVPGGLTENIFFVMTSYVVFKTFVGIWISLAKIFFTEY